MVKCFTCPQRGIVKRPKTGRPTCRECFFTAFEQEAHETIVKSELFTKGELVAIAASGGKDSTVLCHLMTRLNERHRYGLRFCLLSIDEGIKGYRDDSLATVHRNKEFYGLPLHILSYKDLYEGWTMDRIVEKVGQKSNCTYCGVFRRQALDRGAHQLGVSQFVTGHNADDMAETVLMNILRGDIARLQRCTDTSTGTVQNADGDDESLAVRRSKPMKHSFEKEIVMYAYFNRLDYFSTECTYAPGAFRGFARAFIKDLEKLKPMAILDIIKSGEAMAADRIDLHNNITSETPLPTPTTEKKCSRCSYMTNNILCKACLLLDSLNELNK